MKLCAVEPVEVSCPVASLTLSRRRIFKSNYRFPVSDLLAKVQWTLDRKETAAKPLRVELAVLCSAERAFGTFATSAHATILFDLGFVELISDFIAVWYAVPDRIALKPALVPQLAEPFPHFTSKEQDLYRNQLFALLLERDWPSLKDVPEELTAPNNVDDALAGASEHDPSLTITSSQLFRDFATKLCDLKPFLPERRVLFDAAMLWPVDLNDRVYRPGELVFNYLAQDRPNLSEDGQLSVAFLAAVSEAVSLVTLHEVAHVLFDRGKLTEWAKTGEYAAIIARTRQLGAIAGGALAHVTGPLDLRDAFEDARVQRAVNEAFFDIQALALAIGEELLLLPHADAEEKLSVILNAKCAIVALMIFKDHMVATLDAPASRNAIGTAAHDETVLRCMLIFAYLQWRLDEQFPAARHEAILRTLSSILHQIDTLYTFFTIDMMNGLPIWEPEAGSYDDEATRIWVRLLDLMNQSAALVLVPGSTA